PSCGAEIPVSEVLGAQIREEIERSLSQENEARLREAVARAERMAREGLDIELKDLQAQLGESARRNEEAKARELQLRQQARELQEAQRHTEERLRQELGAQFEQEAKARLDAELQQAEARAQAKWQGEFELLKTELATQRQRTAEAQAAELQLRQEKQALEERARTLDLEVARKLDAERTRIEETVRKAVGDEQTLKLREKEKQIEDLRKALEDAKRRSELGSQELQGEVLELDIQAALEQQFPQDRIEPVLKGARGADIVQWVRNERLDDCGAIVWETKNTKHWQPAWLDKLKQDLRNSGGNVAVLVSVALPEGVRGFGRIDGVWVSDLASWPALAVALRDQLIQVAFVRAASQGKNEKMELLYQYLSGDEFRQRVETIVEAFEAMQAQIQKERRAMEKHWAEREKQIQRVIGSTSGMYGALQGIVGAGLPPIAALEFDAGLLEDDRE
ncbi:MAG: hypothetical protein RLZ44_398, partial [Pseudomonadota bacterium]